MATETRDFVRESALRNISEQRERQRQAEVMEAQMRQHGRMTQEYARRAQMQRMQQAQAQQAENDGYGFKRLAESPHGASGGRPWAVDSPTVPQIGALLGRPWVRTAAPKPYKGEITMPWLAKKEEVAVAPPQKPSPGMPWMQQAAAPEPAPTVSDSDHCTQTTGRAGETALAAS